MIEEKKDRMVFLEFFLHPLGQFKRWKIYAYIYF